jgi:dihydrofolate reductase
MRVNLIYAQARGGVIGANGDMPWHLPEDLAHFKATTMGAPVVMGRKTWDSIPPAFRPLPGRRNVVITRQSKWRAEGAEVAHSLDEALARLQDETEVWVMGGAQIYAQAQSQAQRAVVTEIDADFAGDAFAPRLDGGWRETQRSARQLSRSGLAYCFVTWERDGAP